MTHLDTLILDILTLEIGSTITKANGFVKDPFYGLKHVAQGFSTTTVLEGDVSIGVDKAIANLKESSPYRLESAEIFVNSSAAGGLRVTVHGLTLSMTARAAKEASLGAGAIIKKLTAGKIFPHDIDEIKEINPNLIILAGGVEHGDTSTVLENAKILFENHFHVPIVYAGNSVLQKPILKLAEEYKVELWMCENVFPQVDDLNVGPLRHLIHNAFSKHIIHAPGMQKLASYTHHPILPTPGAVLLATGLFAEYAGDVVVIDVGGATTDVHSVTNGSLEWTSKMVDPEPREKRTVEGDLGVFVNANHVLKYDKNGIWGQKLDLLKAMPQAEQEKELTRWLCQTAVVHGIQRHAGTIKEMFTPSGKKLMVQGKDLTAVQWVIGTGGALTRVEGGADILKKICLGASSHLLPMKEAQIRLDKNYLFSALGTIAHVYPDLAKVAIARLLDVPEKG